MNPLAGLIAPALAVLPMPLAGGVDAGDSTSVGLELTEVERGAADADDSAGLMAPEAAPVEARGAGGRAWRSFEEASRELREADRAGQVRIEQRVIIRIAPGTGRLPTIDDRHGLFSPFPPMARTPRTIERKIAQCLPVNSIVRVQPDGSRLLLYMRDQKIVSATLEKGCRARDYYSGFLVERSVDGMLCAGRDKLLARSGANCGMDKLRQLVVIDDDD